MQEQVINISISRIYLVLLAEFGGKGDRVSIDGLRDGVMGRTLNWGF